MSIAERQNTRESLDQLAAQRYAYWQAKRVKTWRLVLVGAVGVGGVVAALAKIPDVSYWVACAALLAWFVDSIWLKDLENGHRQEGAAIQEVFDCAVLELPWPDIKGVDKPTDDRIHQLAALAAAKPKLTDKVRDWYPPSAIPPRADQARLHCQKTNAWWDQNLRDNWKRMIQLLFWSLVLIALVLAIATELTVAKSVALLASGLRLVAWGLTEIKDQEASFKRITRIHKTISQLQNSSPDDARRVQDQIFDHRDSNPVIPDWFYWFYRDQQEAEVSQR